MTTQHTILGCSLALAVSTGCAGERQAFNLQPVAVAHHARVNVVVGDGSVRVVSADIAQAEMHVETEGYDRERDLELSMTSHGDQIDIVAKEKFRIRILDFTRRSLHLEVRVPRGADVAVRSGDGSIEAVAMQGALDVHTGDGDIAVRGARGAVTLHTGDGDIDGSDLDGRIDASTGDGEIKLARARGMIRLHTSDGAILGEDLDGAVDASSGDGRIRLAGRFDALAVQTSDGDIATTLAPGSRVTQPWRLESGDGSIAMSLPASLGAHLQARTGDGSVTSTIPLQQLGRSRVAGDINGGGLPIDIKTSDGSIKLSQL